MTINDVLRGMQKIDHLQSIVLVMSEVNRFRLYRWGKPKT